LEGVSVTEQPPQTREDLPPQYRELLDKWSTAAEKARQTITGQSPEKQDMQRAFTEMLLDLRYPEGKDGSIMNADLIGPLLAYHLVRCGWRPVADKRIIKPRKVPGNVAEGAVEWVDINAPDDPLVNLASMTMVEIAQLPDVWRHEAIRRLGGTVEGDLPEPVNQWKVKTSINIEDAPRDPLKVFK
jgi:hypothetical protein